MMNEETKSRENLNSNVTKVTSSLKLQKLDYIAQMATDYRETLLNPTEESDVALAIGATEELVTERQMARNIVAKSQELDTTNL